MLSLTPNKNPQTITITMELKHIHFLARINLKKSRDPNDSNQTLNKRAQVDNVISCSEFKKKFKQFDLTSNFVFKLLSTSYS